ncbi:MAG: nitroreductase family deazaflavin-dependent oxidoreductase [Chloroflexi bacterium]|nr:nitroreductase family deazaflavin-dependent oxidoreductase [Chloroflexota bacterium]
MPDFKYKPVFYRPSVWQRPIIRFSATQAGSWLFSGTARSADFIVHRLSQGECSLTTLLTNLPLVVLTSTGARSGLQRNSPLLSIPDGNNFALIASNFADSRNPAWYYNLCAHPEVTLTYQEITCPYTAHEAKGSERERLWQKAVDLYAGYAAYQRRANGRDIPIMVLVPK